VVSWVSADMSVAERGRALLIMAGNGECRG
jgi:hypothetical protein